MIKKRLAENNSRFLTEEDILILREKIRPYLTDRRYAHVLSVENEAAALGKIYMPDDIMRLRAAALLHDITKIADQKKQLQYCEEFGIILEYKDIVPNKVYHAFTAAELAKRDFTDFTDDDIISGVRWHTTGRFEMTLFESVIYLADWIEPTRSFDDCIALRRYFYDRLSAENGHDESYGIFIDTMIYSFDMTIDNLLKDKDIIDSNTVCARNYFIAEKRRRQ